MTNSMDRNQTAPIGAVLSWSTLFASNIKCVSNVRQLFAADDFSRRHFSDAFFLGALRVITCAQKLLLGTFSEVSSGARGLHLHPYFMKVSSEGTDSVAPQCNKCKNVISWLMCIFLFDPLKEKDFVKSKRNLLCIL